MSSLDSLILPNPNNELLSHRLTYFFLNTSGLAAVVAAVMSSLDSLILPNPNNELISHQLTYFFLYTSGLAAVVAAVMSSLDSLILSTSSMFTQNVYRMSIRKRVLSLLFYYPPEVTKGEYWGLGVFLLKYVPLVKI